MAILDQYGRPIQSEVLREPQTSRIAQLQNLYLTSALDGLTPSRLAAALRAADAGDLTAQHRIFADMEERDAHLRGEIEKRKLALAGLSWDIVAPPNATAAEKAAAEWVKETLTDAVDPIEDLILALMDGPGHGFAAVELEWRQEGKERLPAFHPRPQEWFRLDTLRRELRLQDSSVDGAVPWTFGWVLHTHGKAKTGYIGRLGLHRVTVWPFIYKAYAVGDLAEFLETYGLPIITGKYNSGATGDEKDSLYRAVVALGHDARAIMPAEMQIEIAKITSSGDGAPHLSMASWADSAQSKAILGQVLSAEAKATGLGSGVADVHNEVRKDIRDADARQVAATITRDLAYPLVAINRGGIDGLARSPRFVFDTGDAEDMKLYSEALPKLASAGMRIDIEWVHEKLRIPVAKNDAILLRGAPAPAVPGEPTEPVPPEKPEIAANTAGLVVGQPTPDVELAERLADEAAPAMAALIEDVRQMAANASSIEALRDGLLAAYADLPADKLTAVMSLGFAVADLAGRDEVQGE